MKDLVRKVLLQKRYLFGLVFAIVFALILYYSQSFKDSVFTEGFPIPGKAELHKISGEHKLESYNWNRASEDDGLPLRYKAVIRLAGWKKVDSFGAMTSFEKDGVMIEVISTTNMIDYYSEK